MALRRPSKYGKGYYSNYSVGGRPLAKPYKKKGRHPKLWSTGRKKRSRTATYTSSADTKIVTIVIAILAGIALCWFAPIFIPIVLGAVLLGCGDMILKKIWNLPSGKWAAPASIGWMLITSLAMAVSFFIGIFVAMGELHAYVLIIIAVVYLVLSALILICRHRKIQKNISAVNNEINKTYEEA